MWAGRAQVRLVIAGEPVVLTVPATGPDETESVERGGVRVELVGLEPGPGAEGTAHVVLVARPADE